MKEEMNMKKESKKVTVRLTPEMQTFMEEAIKIYDYRSWSEMIRALIIAGIEVKKATYNINNSNR